ncbi:putative RNA methyltransferase [Geomicrobium sediminis]|uniref:23S rRNA (Guanine745-N1)-methyltransferase n=1 Tax=Geomicrobium sediminis TaxID=1347788 RepID=A0ABS2PED4_9BACL|nr:methyltransferase domain-containing protein [Geomicrobium sediminis]MBM7633336.1 23S rRNA (guanine745-N1)-methyltransferase [Geomicrobium sediminis]
MKKIDIAAELYKKNAELFRCPVCLEKVEMQERSLVCKQQHSFDLAKKGYIHLLKKPMDSDYTKEMFQSRRSIYDVGLFQQALDEMEALITTHVGKEELNILDIGCGEGSHLRRIIEKFQTSVGVGLDSSKEGIALATSQMDRLLWTVANVEELPIATGSIDVVLNIFSPLNSREFTRVLKPGGVIIKAIPGKRYLQELRDELYGEKGRSLDTTDAITNYAKRFEVLEHRSVSQQVEVKREFIPALIDMTPASWDATDEQKQALLTFEQLNVTVDVEVFIAKIN